MTRLRLILKKNPRLLAKKEIIEIQLFTITHLCIFLNKVLFIVIQDESDFEKFLDSLKCFNEGHT